MTTEREFAFEERRVCACVRDAVYVATTCTFRLASSRIAVQRSGHSAVRRTHDWWHRLARKLLHVLAVLALDLAALADHLAFLCAEAGRAVGLEPRRARRSGHALHVIRAVVRRAANKIDDCRRLGCSRRRRGCRRGCRRLGSSCGGCSHCHCRRFRGGDAIRASLLVAYARTVGVVLARRAAKLARAVRLAERQDAVLMQTLVAYAVDVAPMIGTRSRRCCALGVTRFAHARAVEIADALVLFAELAVTVVLIGKLANARRHDARLRGVGRAIRNARLWQSEYTWRAVRAAIARLLAYARRVFARVARNRRVPERVTVTRAGSFDARVVRAALTLHAVVQHVALERVMARLRRRFGERLAHDVLVAVAYAWALRPAVAALLLLATVSARAIDALVDGASWSLGVDTERLWTVRRRDRADERAVGAARVTIVRLTERRVAARMLARLAAGCDAAREALGRAGRRKARVGVRA